MGRQTKKNKKRLEGMRETMGALAGTAGLGMAFKNMINTASQFESAMNRVESKTMEGSDSMQLLREQARKLGETTQFSATQAAEGMAIFATAGLKTNDILKLMPGLLNLAASGEMDLASAAGIATGTLAQFGLDLSQIGRVNDVLASAAANSKTSVLEMSEALKNTGSLAKIAGLSLEETTSALMVMADSNVKGGDAGTQFMNVLRELSQQSPKVKTLFRKLGLDMSKYIDKNTGRITDLRGIIEALGKTSDKSAFGLKRFTDAFDIRAAKGMAVLAKSGTVALDKMKKTVDSATGSSEKMSSVLMKGLPGAEKLLASATESLSLSFSSMFLPALSKAMEYIASLFSDMASGSPILLKAAAAVAGFALALGVVATAGLLLTPILSAISLNMVVLTGGLILLVPALAALIGYLKKGGYLAKMAKWFENAYARLILFISGLKGLQAFIKGGIGGLQEIFGFIADVVVPMIGIAFDGLAYGIGAIIKTAHDLLLILSSILTLNFEEAWNQMKESFRGAYDEIKGLVRGLIDDFKELFGLMDEKDRKAKQKIAPAGWAAGEEKLTKWREGVAGLAGSQEFAVVMGKGDAASAELKRLVKEKQMQKVGIEGSIRVQAEKGTNINESWIYVDKNGQNLAGR